MHTFLKAFFGLFDQKVGLGFLATFLHWLIGTKDVLVTKKKKSAENLFDEKEKKNHLLFKNEIQYFWFLAHFCKVCSWYKCNFHDIPIIF